MKATSILLASLIFAGHLIPVDAKEPTPLTDCVLLSNSHQGVRQGAPFGGQHLLLKDGDAHYRVTFGSACDILARSSVVQVATDGEKNRLCAKGSSVSSRTSRCNVRSVELIDADDYRRHARRARR